VRSWQAAYRGLLPDELLDSLSVDDRRERWRAGLEKTYEREATHVAETGGVVVAFSAVGPAGDDAAATPGELYALYADPDHWGTGVGRALLAAARASLVGFGFTDALLWVLEGNERATRFYEADGWRRDGGRKPLERGGPGAYVVRYRTSLE
jgi:GNAT superfamily N-acetyltransferase